MKKKFGIVHVIAMCQDCSWETQNYKNGQAIAAKHAKDKKHLVSVEIGLNGTYDGRREGSAT